MLKKKIINNKMKAAVLFKNKSELTIINNLTIPKLKKGQVLIKLAYSGVCHSQLMEIDGLRGKDRYLPHLLGHEGSGKVIDIGIGVKKIKKNDLVVLGWIKGKGIDTNGGIYKYKNKIINSGPVTTFSTFTIVSENRIIKLPKQYSLREAVLFGCAIPTGAGMIFNQIKNVREKTICITGLGGVGFMALIACKALNCKKIIAIDINNKKLKMAKDLGANYTINYNNKNLKSKINKITNSKGVDYGVDCAGKVSTIEFSFSIINKNKGKCLFCSHPTHGEKIKIDPLELISGKKIQGSWGGDVHPDKHIKIIAKKFIRYKAKLNKLIAKDYPLDSINEAINDLKNGNVLRPIISINKDL